MTQPVYVYVLKRQERMGRLKTRRFNSVQQVMDELAKLGIDPVSARARLLALGGVESFRSPYYGLVTVEYPVEWTLPERMKGNPRPPAGSDFVRAAISNVKKVKGNYLHLVRPAGSRVVGQTRSRSDAAGAEEIAKFLKSLRWTDVTDETRASGAGFGQVRYYRARVPAGVVAYESVLLWGELSLAQRARVQVVQAFHQNMKPTDPVRYELVSDIPERKVNIIHMAVGDPNNPAKAPTRRSAFVYTWYPGRMTPFVPFDPSQFPEHVHPMATVKAAEKASMKANPFFDFLFSKPKPKVRTFADMAPMAVKQAAGRLDRWRVELLGPDGVAVWRTHSHGGVLLNSMVLSSSPQVGGLLLNDSEAYYIEKKIDEKSWADSADRPEPIGSVAAQTHEFVLESGPYRGWTLRCVPVQRDTVSLRDGFAVPRRVGSKHGWEAAMRNPYPSRNPTFLIYRDGVLLTRRPVDYEAMQDYLVFDAGMGVKGASLLQSLVSGRVESITFTLRRQKHVAVLAGAGGRGGAPAQLRINTSSNTLRSTVRHRNPFSFFGSSLPSGYFEVSGQSAKSHKRAAEPYSTQLKMGSAEEVVDHLREYFKLSKKDAEAIITEVAALPPKEWASVGGLADPRARAMVRFYAPFPSAREKNPKRNYQHTGARLSREQADLHAAEKELAFLTPLEGKNALYDERIAYLRDIIAGLRGDVLLSKAELARIRNPRRNYSSSLFTSGDLHWSEYVPTKYGLEKTAEYARAGQDPVTYSIVKFNEKNRYAGANFGVYRKWHHRHSGETSDYVVTETAGEERAERAAQEDLDGLRRGLLSFKNPKRNRRNPYSLMDAIKDEIMGYKEPNRWTVVVKDMDGNIVGHADVPGGKDMENAILSMTDLRPGQAESIRAFAQSGKPFNGMSNDKKRQVFIYRIPTQDTWRDL